MKLPFDEVGGSLGVLEGDGGGVGAAVPVVGDVDKVAGGVTADFFHHLGKTVYGHSGNGEQEVALLESGTVGGTVGHDTCKQ